ncbi:MULTISPECIES: hypothetical protein [unclassified Microcoleus]|uniref:hypothetical protein n=1 Tax=unclassified Microcoleus TaxID=2642155 RepID=UPI0025DBECF6|nr:MULTISPECIES: hypothetical protein [unclassified Microcoleus]
MAGCAQREEARGKREEARPKKQDGEEEALKSRVSAMSERPQRMARGLKILFGINARACTLGAAAPNRLSLTEAIRVQDDRNATNRQ